MKKILVIDESSLFRKFLKQKLTTFGFEVVVATNGLDGSAKLRTELPDLVIMDYFLSRTTSIDLLQKKKSDPNTQAIPVIMASPKIDRETIVQVAAYNVKKFFTKPVKIDAMVKSISEILGVTLEIDNTPSIIEAHFNDEILFVEVAQGLNTEKIELLKYKISELIELYEVKNPKVLLIMSSIDVSADDSIKISALLSSIMEHTNARPKEVKILTNSEYMRSFVEARKDYAGIEVTNNLEQAMDGLMGRRAGSYMDKQSKTVQQEFLTATAPKKEKAESIEIKFQDDRPSFDLSDMGDEVKLAVVDDDFVIRELVKTVFMDTKFPISEFENGKQFIDSGKANDFDLVFLDLMMPEMDGFTVLAELKKQGSRPPIIVLSALSQKETVVKALKSGITSYLIKPLKPEAILNKAREVLKTNF